MVRVRVKEAVQRSESFGSGPGLGDFAKMLMSGTSSLQALYKFKTITIKAAADSAQEDLAVAHCIVRMLCVAAVAEGCNSFPVPSPPPRYSPCCWSRHRAGHRARVARRQRKPVLAVETVWPKTCCRICLGAESRCSERGSGQAVFSRGLQLTAGHGRTKNWEGGRQHRRKCRADPCSSRAPAGRLLHSCLREDPLCSLPAVPGAGLQHTLSTDRGNGAWISKHQLQCLRQSQCLLKQDSGGQTAEQGECPAAAWAVIRYG